MDPDAVNPDAVDPDALAGEFETHRAHLRGVGYRMLGSVSEAEDAVQETWLRLARSDAAQIDNLRAWSTTVLARVCLIMLRSRTARGEESLAPHLPDPMVRAPESDDPSVQAELVDTVGLALLVVLETLGPAERLAFVLRDLFAVPFDEIAPLVGRTPAAARQLASRARRRVHGAEPVPGTTARRDAVRQRAVIDAFFAAARSGNFEALVAVLDPDVVVHSDRGADQTFVVRGAGAVAGQAVLFAGPSRTLRPVTVNGAPGVLVIMDGLPVAVMAFTVTDDRVVAVHALAGPKGVAGLDRSAVATGDRPLP